MTKDKAVIFLDRSIEYLLYALIASIPISNAAIEISFSLALVAFLIKKVLKPDFRFVKNLPHLFVLLFFGFCTLSLFNSGEFLNKSLRALFSKWLEYILIFILAEDTLNTPKRLRNAAFILLAVSALIGIDGIVQQFRGIDFLRQRILISRISATFQNQNNFSAYLVPILLLVTSLVFSPQLKKQFRFILFFLWSLLGVCLIFTFTRSAWLGFLIGLVLMLFLSRKIKIAIPLICVFIIILISIPALRQRLTYTFQPGGDEARLALSYSALEMIKENPLLGKGLGTFMDHFPKYPASKALIKHGGYYAHNCFLQIWAEIGLFGLLSFLLFIGAVLYKGIRIFWGNQLPGQSQAVLLGLICAIFGFLVHSFFDTQLYSLQLSALFWFLLGITASFAREGL